VLDGVVENNEGVIEKTLCNGKQGDREVNCFAVAENFGAKDLFPFFDAQNRQINIGVFFLKGRKNV